MKQDNSTKKHPLKQPGTQNDPKSSIQPDPETLGTTDPQEHMEGPISSLMQKIADGAVDNDKEDKANHKERAEVRKK